MTEQRNMLLRSIRMCEGQRVQGGEKAAFHMCAPVGWINDPNGFSMYQGRIHLFYQFYPYAAQWGPMHWGHCVTDDFVRWTLLPPAMAPDQDYETGCFSGSAVEMPDGRQALVYTSHLDRTKPGQKPDVIQTQSLAIGDGVTYERYEHNPVITGDQLPEGASKADFRDPKVWYEDGKYHMVVGSRAADGMGEILLYESENLKSWQYITKIDGSHGWFGRMWECPDFFPLDGKQVLYASPQEMKAFPGGEFHGKNGTVCCIGTYDKQTHQFTRESIQSADYGWDFYAMQTTQTPDGRRVMIAWMKSWDVDVTPFEFTWTGMMTFPRELHIQDGRLCQLPVREIANYYANEQKLTGVADQSWQVLAAGRQLDMTLTVEDASQAVFSVDVAAGEGYYTRITYNPVARRLTIDRTHAGMERDTAPVHLVPLHQLRDTVKLRILLDKYSMELFLNEGQEAATTLIYTPQEAADVRIHAPKPVAYTFECHDIVVPEEE